MSTHHFNDTSGPLTHRQLEILNCLVAASDQNEAAVWLGITPTQIGRQKNKITELLGAENFVQAAILAHERGLISPRALPFGLAERFDNSATGPER
ncbi:hypothetical protein [Glycomyces salinus]|uniref:hypothetical protein n=1 Tax=Glycomyces salinus TaxID=980294 RepID=UPI0018EC8925|nr:hypothetical protein [Glycomyces salinus]